MIDFSDLHDKELIAAIIKNDLVAVNYVLNTPKYKNKTKDLINTERATVIENNNELSPLGFAVHIGSLEIVKLLIQEGAIPSRDNYLLILAAEGKPEVFEYLLGQPGMDVNWKANKYALNPLEWAAKNNNKEVVLYLLLYGVKLPEKNHITERFVGKYYSNLFLDVQNILNIIEKPKGKENLEKSRLDIKNYFIGEKKPLVNLRDENGYTLLQLAIKHHNVELIKILLEAGADIFLVDPDGKTVLEHASVDPTLRDYMLNRIDKLSLIEILSYVEEFHGFIERINNQKFVFELCFKLGMRLKLAEAIDPNSSYAQAIVELFEYIIDNASDIEFRDKALYELSLAYLEGTATSDSEVSMNNRKAFEYANQINKYVPGLRLRENLRIMSGHLEDVEKDILQLQKAEAALARSKQTQGMLTFPTPGDYVKLNSEAIEHFKSRRYKEAAEGFAQLLEAARKSENLKEPNKTISGILYNLAAAELKSGDPELETRAFNHFQEGLNICDEKDKKIFEKRLEECKNRGLRPQGF